MSPAACKDGADQWKMLTSLIVIWIIRESQSSAFLMVMVAKRWPYLLRIISKMNWFVYKATARNDIDRRWKNAS
jgi:hypothetical protein